MRRIEYSGCCLTMTHICPASSTRLNICHMRSVVVMVERRCKQNVAELLCTSAGVAAKRTRSGDDSEPLVSRDPAVAGRTCDGAPSAAAAASPRACRTTGFQDRADSSNMVYYNDV